MSLDVSPLEAYCGICENILNPPLAYSQVYSLENAPSLPICNICYVSIEKVKEIIGLYNIK